MARSPKYTLSGKPDAAMVDRIQEMFVELYRLITNSFPHNLISESHGDTRVDPDHPNVERGDLLVGQRLPFSASTIRWQRLALGVANRLLKSNGTDLVYAQADLTTDVTGILPVVNGGTGVASLTPYAVVLGGTTGTGPVAQVDGLGTAGQVLTSNGAGAEPTWEDNAGGSGVDHVIMTTGAEPGQILTDGAGNGIYVEYEP